MNIDIDEARIARREEEKEAPTITFGGSIYTLSIELPVEAIDPLARVAATQAVKDGPGFVSALLDTAQALLSDEDFADFKTKRPSADDLIYIVNQLPEVYGLKLPESSGLPETSDSTTALLSPPSDKPTG